MHHDGMHFFPFIDNGKPSSTHGLLCINHEYTDDGLLHSGGMQDWSAEKVAKSKAAHGEDHKGGHGVGPAHNDKTQRQFRRKSG